ncbi:MAG TPA: hypothetical protein VFU73_13705 [Actinocrinis sp.]|nr:hypothetical protein [Actinocrinis sp.]
MARAGWGEMTMGESVVAVERPAPWWRSRPAIITVALVALAGAGLGVWSLTRPSDSGWHELTLPQPAGVDGSGLSGVTVLPDGTAWAVGYADLFPSHNSHTVVQRWDGHQWAAVSTPALGEQVDSFNGVAASSDSDVWAVGLTSTDPAAHGAPVSGYTDSTLIEHWDGTRWTALDVAERPRLPSDDAILNAAAAVDRTNAWAVGRVANTALIEHWDGTRWSVPPSPDLHSDKTGGLLFDVKGVSATDVWAVGKNSTAGRGGCLIEHYDGSAWSVVTCPVPAAERTAALLTVAGVSPKDLWAVGYYTTGVSDTSQTAHSLIEHFDGAKWSTVPSPSVALGTGLVAQTSDELRTVAARSSNDVYAVSSAGVVIHWDGTRWTRTSTRLPGYVDGMVAQPGGDIWAVGSQTTPFPKSLANVEKP